MHIECVTTGVKTSVSPAQANPTCKSVLVLSQPLLSLAFVHCYPCPDELVESIQVLGTIPFRGEGVSPWVRSRGGGSPPGLLWRQRVTWKTQCSDVSPRRKIFKGV